METKKDYISTTGEALVEAALHTSTRKQNVKILAKTPGASDAHIRAKDNLYMRTEDGKNFVKREVEWILVWVERHKDGVTLAVETQTGKDGIKWTSYVQVADILSASIQK